MAITWESVCRVPRGIVVFRGTLNLLYDILIDGYGSLGQIRNTRGRTGLNQFRGRSSLRFRIAPRRLVDSIENKNPCDGFESSWKQRLLFSHAKSCILRLYSP